MTWRAGGARPGNFRKPAAGGSRREGGNRVATGGLMSRRRSDQKKAAWRPLRHLIRLRWTSREFGLDRIGFGQAIHFHGVTFQHLLGLR